MLLLLVPVLYYACNLKTSSTDEWSIKKVLKLLMTSKIIYSLYSLRTQTKYSSQKNELEYVTKLQGMNSDLSQKHLVYYLESPDYHVRSSALLAMNNLELEEKSKLAVYKATKSPLHVGLSVSSMILAKNNFTKALPLFRQRLTSTNIESICNSMIALVIMKDNEGYRKIIKIFKESGDPLIVTYGARSIAIMKDINSLECLLNKLTHFVDLENINVVNEIVLTVSRIISCNEAFYKFIRVNRYDKNKGLANIIDSIDKNKILGLSDKPETILKYYYYSKDNVENKNILINFIKEAIKLNINTGQTFKILLDYLNKTEHNYICSNLLICIFIKLFCKTEPNENEINNKESLIWELYFKSFLNWLIISF